MRPPQEKEHQAAATKKQLKIRRKELESIVDYNRKRSFPRADRIQGRNLFQDTNTVNPGGQDVVQATPGAGGSIQGASQNPPICTSATANLPPLVPADHYVTLVQNVVAAATLTKDITIMGDSPEAEIMRRSQALLNTAAIQQQ
jgi:hypothetical protein